MFECLLIKNKNKTLFSLSVCAALFLKSGRGPSTLSTGCLSLSCSVAQDPAAQQSACVAFPLLRLYDNPPEKIPYYHLNQSTLAIKRQ
jgi:hypothetical protein